MAPGSAVLGLVVLVGVWGDWDWAWVLGDLGIPEPAWNQVWELGLGDLEVLEQAWGEAQELVMFAVGAHPNRLNPRHEAFQKPVGASGLEPGPAGESGVELDWAAEPGTPEPD